MAVGEVYCSSEGLLLKKYSLAQNSQTLFIAKCLAISFYQIMAIPQLLYPAGFVAQVQLLQHALEYQ